MNEAVRHSQYLICKSRGHLPIGVKLPTNPPLNICKRCVTLYRDGGGEYNVPRRPEASRP